MNTFGCKSQKVDYLSRISHNSFVQTEKILLTSHICSQKVLNSLHSNKHLCYSTQFKFVRILTSIKFTQDMVIVCYKGEQAETSFHILSNDQISCSYQSNLYFFFQIMHEIEDQVFMFNIKGTIITLVHHIAVSQGNCYKIYCCTFQIWYCHLGIICFWTFKNFQCIHLAIKEKD